MCIDHPEVQAMIPRVLDRRVVTYGLSPQADVRAVNVRITPGGSNYDVVITDRSSGRRRMLQGLFLPMLGHHNVQNSLAAIAIGNEMELSDEKIAETLAGFSGVKRRFTRTGTVNALTVIDDSATHPVETPAVLPAPPP